MKGNTKCRNWGSLDDYGCPEVIVNITIQYSTYDFLFNFNRKYVSILYHFRGIWSKMSLNYDVTQLLLQNPVRPG